MVSRKRAACGLWSHPRAQCRGPSCCADPARQRARRRRWQAQKRRIDAAFRGNKDQSLPAVFYLAARYPDDFEAALIANANVGGDNCHRGAVLGALLGVAMGLEAIPERWMQGLTARTALDEEIENFIARFGWE